MTSAILLCPDVDFFLFRQRRLSQTATQQAFSQNVLGTAGWTIGITLFQHLIVNPPTTDDPEGAVVSRRTKLPRRSLPRQATLTLLAYLFLHALSATAFLVHPPFSVFEKFFTEIAHALTFMLCNGVMQKAIGLHCERLLATKYSLLQSFGAVSMFVSKQGELFFLSTLQISSFEEWEFVALVYGSLLLKAVVVGVLLHGVVGRMAVGSL